MTERLLTAREVAERLGVPAKWSLAQARAGNLPHVKLGRYVRFDAADVDAWLESLKTGGGPSHRVDEPSRDGCFTDRGYGNCGAPVDADDDALERRLLGDLPTSVVADGASEQQPSRSKATGPPARQSDR